MIVPALFLILDCPITADDIASAIHSLPTKKVLGVDQLRIEIYSLCSTYWHRSFTFYSECIGLGLTFYGLGVLLKLFSCTRKIRHLTMCLSSPLV